MATLRARRVAGRKVVKTGSRPAASSRTSAAAARSRARPGAGGGKYFRIEVRPKSDFVFFRTQDVGRKGHIQRVAGRRKSGSWATVTWLIGKEDAHLQNGRLVPDSVAARKLLEQLGSRPLHTQGDRFKASDRPNVPERSKPTGPQRRARAANIQKAQAARHKN
ncbi:MAG TPA: hypothetical protein VFH29_05735 [Anaerolineales bacterium]|nr:hypothetical protein [Anaerolineales bacterium]